MEATTYDFSKVSALVRSQLRSALNNEASKDAGEFDRIMFGTPYQVIRDRRLKELEWADDLLGRDAIRYVLSSSSISIEMFMHFLLLVIYVLAYQNNRMNS
jgi:hypothetical protein